MVAAFALRDGFDDRLRSRIESGLPTSILYRVELRRERKRWMDPRLQVNTLEVTAMYDAVARVYNVYFKLDAKLIESRTVHDLKAVEEAMTLIGPVPVFQVTGIPREWRLLLRVEAEMGSRTILSFIPATLSTAGEAAGTAAVGPLLLIAPELCSCASWDSPRGRGRSRASRLSRANAVRH